MWAARAKEVQEQMKKFVQAHIAAVGVTQGLYIHILHAHTHEQIAARGDLRVRQSQGLEHCHKVRKRIGCEATNRKPGERLTTMLGHVHIKAYLARLQSQSFFASDHEKKKAAKIRRLHAKIARVQASMPTL